MGIKEIYYIRWEGDLKLEEGLQKGKEIFNGANSII